MKKSIESLAVILLLFVGMTACDDNIVNQADDIVIADMDLDLIREVRNTWQFFRDRRPETYGAITDL